MAKARAGGCNTRLRPAPHFPPMPDRETLHVAELLGDGISPELSASVHQVAAALPLRVQFHPIDFTLEARRQNAAACYDTALAAIHAHRVAMKYPTVTATESPNKVLRERCNFSVIHRPVASLPGVKTRHDGNVDLHIVRVAVGGTYEDAGRRIGDDVAVSIRVIERRPSREAALFAFRLARRLSAGVVSSSKHTIQRATDGLFEEVVLGVAREFPEVPHHSELFDSLLYKLLIKPEAYRVVVTPNEYGDFLSDMACGMIGSLGLGASANYAFDAQGEVTVAMFDPAGGTAPDIAGKGICNPSASLLAFAMLLTHAGFRGLGTMVDEAVRGAIAAGESTRDLGGKLDTAAFTSAVATRLAAKRGG
jgi:isocitrate dehydrogenase (NAD+)